MTSSRTPSPTSFHTAPSTPQSCTASVQASVSVAPPPSASSSDASPVVLSPEQLAVLQRVKDGQSVFFTGSAGECNTSLGLRPLMMNFKAPGNPFFCERSYGTVVKETRETETPWQ